MTRLIAGSAGGLRLRTPKDSATRPTSERVREALFAILEHRLTFAGARVLDLYAGSGSLGLEAASRGASWVLLIEAHRGTASLAAGNARATGLADVVQVAAEPVERRLAAGPPGARRQGAGPPAAGLPGAGPPGAGVDLVLADPPYHLDEESLGRVLALLVDRGWTDEDALVVVERSRRSPEPPWPTPLRPVDMRRYGDTTIWFARHQA